MALNVNKNWVMLFLSLAIGGVAAYLGNVAVRERIKAIEAEAAKGQQMVKIVVPTKDMSRGEALTPGVLAIREIPRDYVQSDSITPETLDQVENQRLLTPVKRGEQLSVLKTEGAGNKVFSSQLQPGRRALTVPVNDENSISGMMRPGDHIDLIVVAKPVADGSGGQTEKDTVFPLLSDVTVLATGTAVSAADPNRGGAEQRYATMTLDVTPQDADRIIVAQNAGQLKAVLRHPDDRVVNRTAAMTAENLFQDTKKFRSIEMISGGGKNELSIAQAPAARSFK